MITLNEILDAAQNLPSSDRARLIASLWETTSPLDWVLPNSAWVAEVNRRSDEFDAGKTSGSDWTDVRQRARKAAGLDD
jgi:putative addiction module component (TIGR02574 family)